MTDSHRVISIETWPEVKLGETPSGVECALPSRADMTADRSVAPVATQPFAYILISGWCVPFAGVPLPGVYTLDFVVPQPLQSAKQH